MGLKASSYIIVAASPDKVFRAVHDPRQLEGYFVSKASGPMEAGTTLQWKWEDMNAAADVHVQEVVPEQKLAFRWGEGAQGTTVTLTFTRVKNGTRVDVLEDGWPETPEGISGYGGNMQGWANFLACLKAYVEHGINLRRNAFQA